MGLVTFVLKLCIATYILSFAAPHDVSSELDSNISNEYIEFPSNIVINARTFSAEWFTINGKFTQGSNTILAEHRKELDKYWSETTESFLGLRARIKDAVEIHFSFMIEAEEPPECRPSLVAIVVGPVIIDLFGNWASIVNWKPDFSFKRITRFETPILRMQNWHKVTIVRRGLSIVLILDGKKLVEEKLNSNLKSSKYFSRFGIGNRCSTVRFKSIRFLDPSK